MSVGSIVFFFLTNVLGWTSSEPNVWVMLKVEEWPNPLHTTFVCSYDNPVSRAEKVELWYRPHYPTAYKITIYRWSSVSNKEYNKDDVLQGRMAVSHNFEQNFIKLLIRQPILHDSGTYHCEVTFSNETQSSPPVEYQRSIIPIMKVTCERAEQFSGKTGIISCHYFPVYSSPTLILWKWHGHKSKHKIYSYSFLHARGTFHGESQWLDGRLSHQLNIRTGRTYLKIENTSLTDAGVYELEVRSHERTFKVKIPYAVKDKGALTLRADSNAEGGIILSGDYDSQAFALHQIELLSLECEKQRPLFTYDVLKNETELHHTRMDPFISHRTGHFSLILKNMDLIPLVMRCNVNTSQGTLNTDISIQYYEGIEQEVELIVNTWPERVSGKDAETVCRQMCSVLPDITSPFVFENIVKWAKNSNPEAIWVATGTTSVVSIGHDESSAKCHVIQPGDRNPIEQLCSNKEHLICIILKRSSAAEKKEKYRGLSGMMSLKFGIAICGVISLTYATAIIIFVRIRKKNKSEYFRKPWCGMSEKEDVRKKLLNKFGENISKHRLQVDFEKINDQSSNMLLDHSREECIVVGVLSSGFDLKHPCFRPPLPEPRYHLAIEGHHGKDTFGQGTFLAGVVIGQCEKVLKNIQLINLQAVSHDGKITTKSIKSCLDYCLVKQNTPDILLIPNCFTHIFSDHLRTLLEKLMMKTVFVISASNDMEPPKSMTHVAALTKLIIGSHENSERCRDSPDQWGIDFLAPGTITSAMTGSAKYVKGNGTIVSAAWVCGILVHVMLQARCIEKKNGLSVEYTTWMMHNVLLAMTKHNMRTRGNGYGSLTPETVLLNETELKKIVKAASN